MSAGTIVTIGGHEVYYAGRPRSPLAQEPLSGNMKSHTTRPHCCPPIAFQRPCGWFPRAGSRPARLLAIILVRHTRRPS